MSGRRRAGGVELYIDLYELLKLERDTHQDHRAFGLTHRTLLEKPIALLAAWRESKQHLLSHPSLSEKIGKLLSRTTLLLLVLAFFLGIFSGVGLLRYSGDEPVNLIYFLLAVFLLPLLTMTMTLFAMWRASSAEATLIHLSPAYWMENLLLLLPGKSRELLEQVRINPLLANWMVIKRSQELALAFSLGLFLALVVVVSSEDIAFSWSTTLHITGEEMHRFLTMVAWPWSMWLPQAVPSAELIGQSHYFRLGGRLSSDMVANAAMLGEWWKFLAMTTLFYALLLRLLFLFIAALGLRRATTRAILSLEGVRELLREMREPLITTQAPTNEQAHRGPVHGDLSAVVLRQSYEAVIGWAMTRETIVLRNEELGIESGQVYEAGGSHSLEEDREVSRSLHGEVLLYVKSWEVPTMDFVDFLTGVLEEDTSVTIYPLGTDENGLEATEAQYMIWERKISSLGLERVRMIR